MVERAKKEKGTSTVTHSCSPQDNARISGLVIYFLSDGLISLSYFIHLFSPTPSTNFFGFDCVEVQSHNPLEGTACQSSTLSDEEKDCTMDTVGVICVDSEGLYGYSPLQGAKGTEGTQRQKMRKRASERLPFCSGIWRILAEVISVCLPAEKESP